MATSLSSPLHKLQEELTCSVCLSIYDDPKSLPCLHTFCQKCLEGLTKTKEPKGERDSYSHYIFCPNCRRRTELPEGEVDFPQAFHLSNLKEVYNLLKKVSDPQQATCNNCKTAKAIGCCKDCIKLLCQECIDTHKKWVDFRDHEIKDLDEVTPNSTSQLLPASKISCSKPNHTKKIKFYCDTCDEAICGDCVLLTHRNHQCQLIADCFDSQCASINSRLYSVKERARNIENAIHVKFTEKENSVKKKGEEIKIEIRTMVKQMINLLHQSEKQMSSAVDMVTSAKVQVLKEQVKSAETSLDIVKNCQTHVEESLEFSTQQHIMLYKKQLMERMSQVLTQVKVEEAAPFVIADLQLVKDDNVFKSLKHIGDNVLYSSTAVHDCKVKKIRCIEHLPEDEMVSFPLSIEAMDSSLLSIQVSSLKCSLVQVGKEDQLIPTTVTTTTHPGVYKIHCKTSTRGTHIVKVQVHEVQLEDTSLVIPFNPYREKILPVRTIPDLNGPWGVAISDNGHIIVTECRGNLVTILDSKGEKTKSFGGDEDGVKFTSPSGVAITKDDFIYVSDNIHGIQKLSMDGQCIAKLSRYLLNIPEGLAISPQTGHVYVANRYRHQVLAIDSDLAIANPLDGYLSYPHDVAVDNEGIVYVTDEGNNRIRKFSPDGTFVAQFGTFGYGPGEFKWAKCITIDTASTGLVYVTDEDNHRISVFKSDGQFIRCFGKEGAGIDEFMVPSGLAFDNEGFLYVCDYCNNRLLVY